MNHYESKTESIFFGFDIEDLSGEEKKLLPSPIHNNIDKKTYGCFWDSPASKLVTFRCQRGQS